MASVVEAFEDTVLEGFSFIKTFILAIPVYYSYVLYSSGKLNEFYICGGITAALLFLIMICIFNNVRNSNNSVFPTVKQFLLFGIKSLFCVVPILSLLGFCVFKLWNIEIPFPEFQIVYQIIVCTIFSIVGIMSVIQFAKTGKISSAFDVVTILKYFVDILIRIIYMLLQLAILNLLALGSIAYTIWVFLPLDHPLFIGICSVFLVANLLASAHYLAQVEYEVVPREEKEHII